MRERWSERERRRVREFEAFVAGAGGRLLHAAALLTGEPPERCPAAEDLLARALARTYAGWDRLRGEDPYDRARQELAARFAHTARRYRAARWGGPARWSARPGARTGEAADAGPGGGLLGRLTPQERLVLVLRLYEGIAEEQAAATLGLPVERVRAICTRAVFRLADSARHGPPGGHGPRPLPAEPTRGPAASGHRREAGADRVPVPQPPAPAPTVSGSSRSGPPASAPRVTP